MKIAWPICHGNYQNFAHHLLSKSIANQSGAILFIMMVMDSRATMTLILAIIDFITFVRDHVKNRRKGPNTSHWWALDMINLTDNYLYSPRIWPKSLIMRAFSANHCQIFNQRRLALQRRRKFRQRISHILLVEPKKKNTIEWS